MLAARSSPDAGACFGSAGAVASRRRRVLRLARAVASRRRRALRLAGGYPARMVLCIDADHRADATITAALGIADFSSDRSVYERVHRSTSPPEAYVPGEFYRRELPGTIEAVHAAPDVAVVVIDGYVWLGGERPGLGARLHDAVRLPVVGVAKTPFRDNDRAVEVLRGGSSKPLYVTAVGMDLAAAAANVARMHGPHRLPTMLKRVDRLARDA